MNARVKLIRKALGLTQEQLAQRLGIGKAALSMIETGKAGLSTRNRNILVQELNINPDYLELGTGEMFSADRRHSRSGTFIYRPGAVQTGQFHPHPQPAEVRRCHLHRRRLDVSAPEEWRHCTLQAAGLDGGYLLGRYVPALNRPGWRGVCDGEVYSEGRPRGLRQAGEPESPPRRQRHCRGAHPSNCAYQGLDSYELAAIVR